MCSTCGCGQAEFHHHHEHADESSHCHEHEHHHDHEHHHEHPHSHAHTHAHTHPHSHHTEHAHEHHYGDEHSHLHDTPTESKIIHQHFYYHNGDVHHHYHNPITVDDDLSITHSSEQQLLDYSQGAAQTHVPGLSQKRIIEIEQNVLSKNNAIAEQNRQFFNDHQILALNMVSSPGSGKTTLLVETLKRLQQKTNCAVIEGDQQTSNDAERIRATGVSATQVNTGKGCHLDAQMIQQAVSTLNLTDNSLLFIENVGNLVCPASFDLGERHKVALLSITEGEDKPLKYPHMFAAASLLLINKIDLRQWVDFDIDKCIQYARSINPQLQIIQISATSGEGLSAWLDWLGQQQCA